MKTKRPHYTGDRTYFKVTCGDREITQGYVHPGVGVTFALDCDNETRASIDSAAMELHRDGRLAAHGAMQGLYMVERVTR